jgi:gliding motility-associated-like protein
MPRKTKHIALLGFTKLSQKALGMLCFIVTVFASTQHAHSQVITNNGAAIGVSAIAHVTTHDIENKSDTIANNGYIYLTGNWNNAGTHSPGTGTVNFDGTQSQYVTNSNGEYFNKLIVENTAVAGERVKLNNRTTVHTSVDINTGTLQIDSGHFINQGTTNVLGTIIDSSLTGTNVFNGLVRITSTGKWDFSPANSAVEYKGGLMNTGIFTSGNGNYDFTTNVQNLTGTNPIIFRGNVNVKNAAQVTADGTITMGNSNLNTFNVQSGSFNTATADFKAVAKTNVYTATLSDNNPNGSNIFADSLNVYAGGIWNFGGNDDVEFNKGIHFFGSTFISGNGNYLFKVNSQNILAYSSISIDGAVTIGNGIMLTNYISSAPSGLIIKGEMSGTNAASEYINSGITSYENAKEPMLGSILNNTYLNNIFRYSGNTQTMAAGTNGEYHHLEIDGTSTKTFHGNIKINGNLSVNNNTILQYGNGALYRIHLAGNLNASAGTIDMSPGNSVNHQLYLLGISNSLNQLYADDQSAISYLGPNNQQIFASLNYRNILFAGTGTKLLQGNATANGDTVGFYANVLTTNNELFLDNDAITINRSTGRVIGNLKRKLATVGKDYNYPVGTDTSYNPLFIKLTNMSQGNLLVNFKPEDIGSNGLPLFDDGEEVYEQFTNGYWFTKASNNLSSSNYNLKLTAEGFGIDSSSSIIKKENGILTLDGDHIEINGNDISRNTFENGLSTNYTAFGIGKGRPNISQNIANDTICNGTTKTYIIIATGRAGKNVTYQWYKKPNILLSNGTEYSGVTTHSLTIYNAPESVEGEYYCIIKDHIGHPKISNNAFLRIDNIPLITVLQTKDTICNKDYAYIQILNSGNDTTYSWSVYPDAGLLWAQNGASNTVNQQLNNTTDIVQKAIYNLKAVGHFPRYCTRTKNDTILVNPTVRLGISLPDTINCNATPISFNVNTPSVTTGIVKYNSSLTKSDNGASVLTGVSNRNNALVLNYTDVITNNSSEIKNVKYFFNPYIDGVNGGTCEISKDTSLTVYINPTPNLSVVADDYLVCDSTVVKFSLNTQNGNVLGSKRFEWSAVDTLSTLHSFADGKYRLDTTFTDKLINTADLMRKVKYSAIPVFEDSRNISKFYCKGIVNNFGVNIMPDMKLDISADTFFGGWNVKCKSDKNGFIRLTAKGGAISYYPGHTQDNDTFYWSNNKKTRNLPDIGVGTYKVRVIDREGCNANAQISLKEPNLLLVDVLIVDSIKCATNQNAKIEAFPTGGTAAYSYKWNDGHTEKYLIATQGERTVLVKDLNGCSRSKSIYVPPSSENSILLRSTKKGDYNTSCFNSSDGELTVSHSTLPTKYTYILTRTPLGLPGYVYQTDTVLPTSFSNLKSGKYDLVVINDSTANGCEIKSSGGEITAPKDVKFSHKISSYYNNGYNLSCDNSMNGYDSLTVSGGHGVMNFQQQITFPYRYTWATSLAELENKPANTKPYITNLDAGKYYLKLEDTVAVKVQGGAINVYTCPYYDSIVLVKPKPLTIQQSKTDSSWNNGFNISCYNGNNALLGVTVSGGLANNKSQYVYEWKKDNNVIFLDNNGNDSSKITNLTAGVYKLKISYGVNNSCGKIWSFNVRQPDSISIFPYAKNYNGFNVSCFNSSDGRIDSTIVKGGALGYNYKWFNSSETLVSSESTAQLLKSGMYKISVTDKNSCSNTSYYKITSPNAITTSTDVFKASCFSLKDGRASVKVIDGGVQPYKYLWTSKDATFNLSKNDSSGISEVPKGYYFVTTTDKNNCEKTDTVFVVEPNQLKVKLEITTNYNGRDISCYGATDASIRSTVTGGTEPYSYLWNTLDEGTSVTNVGVGKYAIAIRDAGNCKDTSSIIVKPTPIIYFSKFTSNHVKCFEGTNGGALAEVKGGTLGYKYFWTDSIGSSWRTNSVKNFKEGKYWLSVSDSNKCAKDTLIVITQPEKLRLISDSSASIVMPYCPATKDGKISIHPVGGTLPYNFVWKQLLTNDVVGKTLKNSPLGDTITRLEVGRYLLELTDSNLCRLSDDTIYTIIAKHSECVDAVKSFSPNKDGVNDTWNILVGDMGDKTQPAKYPDKRVPLSQLYPKAVVEVYNRWGEKVFKSGKGYFKEWDGTSNGIDLPMDSYYYSIDLFDGTEKFVGIVSIIR